MEAAIVQLPEEPLSRRGHLNVPYDIVEILLIAELLREAC